MPRKITAASRNKRTGIPHSPFQILIDNARVGRGISMRALAKAIGANHSAVHIWLTNANGYPHPKRFTPKHLKATARVLHLSTESIQVALDRSRQLYATSENPMPPTLADPFRALIEILEGGKSKYLIRASILNIAKRLYASAALDLPTAPGRR